MTALAGAAKAPLDLSRRSSTPEWLDGADLHPAELEPVLCDLARFNGAMLGHWPVLSWLRRATEASRNQSPTLVDVGCGYGDLLRAIRRWSRKRGLNMRLIGIDLSRETIRIARSVTEEADAIDYRVADVFAFKPDGPVDFVVSSLLTHHMPDDTIVNYLRWMEATARKGWLIYDLQRHAVPYYFIGLIGRLTRLHPIVVHDGQISVTRSLTRAEWEQRLAAAGIARATVVLRWFLFRYAIGRRR